MTPLRHLFAREQQPAITTEIHLQNNLVVVHPTPPPSTDQPPQQVDNETLLSGCVVIVSDSDVLLWNIRISLVIHCKYRRPGEQVWQEGIIYEQGRIFNHLDHEARISTSIDRRSIHRQIDFALMVPSNIPTHEYLQHAMILPQIRLSVEYSKNTWSDAALRALPSTPPVYVDEHSEGRTVAGRQMRTQSHTGADVKWPPADPTEIVITHGSSSLGAPKHPVQTFIKNFAIIANGNTVSDGARTRSHKRGVSAGVGDITPIQEFRNNPDDPTTKHHYPTETFVLVKDGVVPSPKQPKTTNRQVLFNAQSALAEDNDNDDTPRKPTNDGISYTWQPGRIRINDDHSMRPSVFPGTHTPLNITHELSLRVFFSVKGEAIDGSPIPDGQG
ncbi:hypothetical protein QFC22_005608, partial [Naganishia vaughanmartiniae]